MERAQLEAYRVMAQQCERACLAAQYGATDRSEAERAQQARRHATGLRKVLDAWLQEPPPRQR